MEDATRTGPSRVLPQIFVPCTLPEIPRPDGNTGGGEVTVWGRAKQPELTFKGASCIPSGHCSPGGLQCPSSNMRCNNIDRRLGDADAVRDWGCRARAGNAPVWWAVGAGAGAVHGAVVGGVKGMYVVYVDDALPLGKGMRGDVLRCHSHGIGTQYFEASCWGVEGRRLLLADCRKKGPRRAGRWRWRH